MTRFGKALLLLALATCIRAVGEIEQSEVLVVYNSQSTDSQQVHDYYKSVRTGVLSFDLNDASILSPTISYADFASKLRDPIRAHLNSNNLEEQICVIVLTKGIPHRIQSLDLTNPNVGDNAGNTVTAYTNGNATFASVDSELTLLQFNLETGESGASMDSNADRAVLNPYYDETARLKSFSRSEIAGSDLFFSQISVGGGITWWQLREQTGLFSSVEASPGNIYLTARLDADTVQEVKDIIDRAQQVSYRKTIDAIILDEDATGTLDGTDYADAATLVSGDWTRVFHDTTNNFLTGTSNPIALPSTTEISGPVAYLHSFGVNHNGSNSQIRDYLATFERQLPPGAMFSAYESFGAVGLGGLGNKGQAQVEEWFTVGGTFATGPAWEPFAFGISRSAVFLDRFMNDGFTFVEAAWASILQISWQTVVIGDPLAKASFATASAYETWTFSQAGNTAYANPTLEFAADFDGDGLANGYEFILELDPASDSSDSDRTLELQFDGNDRTLLFTFDESNADGTIIELEASNNLSPDSWTTLATRDAVSGWTGPATVQETPAAGFIDTVIRDDTSNLDKRFYRLNVVEVED